MFINPSDKTTKALNGAGRAGEPKTARGASRRRIRAGAAKETFSEPDPFTFEAQRLAAIVEGSEDAIVSKTLDGTILTWNDGATRMFGYCAQEMIGQPIARIVPEDLQAEEGEIIARLRRGERISHFDTFRRAKDGRHIAVSLTVSPLRDAQGQVVGASKIVRDISTRKETEEALRRANEEAQQLRLDAEAANRAKTEFLAVMSHEIRTPLNSIKGFVDLLTNSTALTQQQRRYADLTRSATSALLTIVDDILDFSKVEAGRMDLSLHPFSLWTLILDTMAIVAPAMNAKNLELICAIESDAPDWVMGDHGRLRQTLLNLLNNAAKFTEQGSIKVSAGSRLGADGRMRIHFSVADTGVGVPREHQHRLFKQFSQADSSISRQHGGTGLGLAICKRLVELMDGEIGIDSEVGQGATVWFTAYLPSTPSPALSPMPVRPPERIEKAKARILVVDDIDTNLEIVEAYLEDSGYHVHCVTSAFDALQLLASDRFDLILMDVQMPGMDGVTATQRIRALPGPAREIPIIAMSGNVLPQQVKSFLEAGMSDHVGKPIDRARLDSHIRRWLPDVERGDARVELKPVIFDRATFETFVLVVGSDKAQRIGETFLDSLSKAFQSTFSNTQREAHALINTAGVLGLSGLVGACRRVAELSPIAAADCRRKLLEEIRQAQAVARHTLSKQLLPQLRGVHPAPVSHCA